MTPKYDKETLNQLKDLSQDEKLTALEKRLNESDEKRAHQLDATNGHIVALKDRVDVLEGVRLTQIEINRTVKHALSEKPAKPSFFQRFFK